MIKVLIVEDSPVAQEFLTYILSSDAEIEVVGVSRNGAEAIEAVPRLRPAVITMDIHMPVMDGFEATRRIMETAPTPIVIVSGSASSKEVDSTFRAMEAGALAVVLRPPGMDDVAFGECSKELIQTVKLMSEIKVVRRRPRAVFWAETRFRRRPVRSYPPYRRDGDFLGRHRRLYRRASGLENGAFRPP